jgi:hypothetical protein
MKEHTLPFNLQFFAEPADGVSDAGDTGKELDAAGEKTDTKGTDAGDADPAEKDAGKTVDPAPVENKKEDIEALVQEAVKKATMSPEEKAEYEKKEKEKALLEREDAISLRERRADAKEILADNGLPVEFRDMVMGKDKEETQANVKTFKEKFDAAVQAQVEVRLKGKTPAASTGYTGGTEKETLLAQVESYL